MIPIDFAIQAEDMYGNDVVRSFERSGKSQWEFEVEDQDEKYQVQIKASETTISKISCTCAKYKSENACAHIFACFYELRKQIEIAQQQKKEAKKTTARRTRGKGAVKVSDFITKLTESELKDFVRKYASNDKKFAASLKARFARKMINQSNESVYKSILDSIIGPIRIKDQKVGGAELRNFEYVCNELIRQYEDAVSLQQYTEGFFILKAILNKGCYIHHNSKKESEKIMQIIIQIHTFLDELFYCPLAPELRKKLYVFAIELAQKSYYRILHNSLNIFEILNTHRKEDEEYKLINQATKEKREQFNLDQNSSVFLDGFLIRMDINDKKYDGEAFLKFPLEYQNKVIDSLIQLEAIDPAIRVLEDLVSNKNVSRFVKEKLIYVYSLSEYKEKHTNAVFDYFVQYKNPKYIKQLQSEQDENWLQIRDIYLAKIEALKAEEEKVFLKAKFLYEIGEHDHLMKVFPEIDELETLMSVDREIIKLYPKEVIDIYFIKACDILDNYVGTAASKKIKRMLSHIENVSDFNKRSKLYKRIKDHYIHRPQLIEDIISVI